MNNSIVRITPTTLASKRTRDRVKQHGPEFLVKNEAFDVFGFMGVKCVLIHSMKDDWFGWIPENEIDID